MKKSEIEILRAAVEEAIVVLNLCTTRRFEAPEDEEVGALGARLGYGAVMSAASRKWSQMFDHTKQAGSQHTCGPCEATVQRTLRLLQSALEHSTVEPK